MSIEAKKPNFLTRQPLSAFGKLAVVALLGAAVSSGILAILIGYPDNTALLIVTAALLVIAGIAAIGYRWIAPLIIVVTGIFLYMVATEPFVAEHLTNPKGAFPTFVLDILIIAFLLVAFVASIGATLQNYLPGSQPAPRWLPSALTGVVTTVAGIVIGAILIGAISQPAASTVTGTQFTNGVPTVHMNAGSFLQPSVTIPKGSKLLLVDDVASLHIIANGSWQNGAPKPATEPGAPTVNNVQINGNSAQVGPFVTAGTYHVFCTVHQGMNLTVIVQ